MAEIQDANVQENTTPTNSDPEIKQENNNDSQQDTPTIDNSAEIAKLRAEIKKQKEALDKATKEAGDYKKQLRASKSAEEQRAEEERERQEAIENELKELRKKADVAHISKTVMSFVGDENVATEIAEHLHGATDIDAAIDILNKAWAAKEKKLKIEYGKIPAPESGDGTPQITKQQLADMSYSERLDLKRKYPEYYRKLTKGEN